MVKAEEGILSQRARLRNREQKVMCGISEGSKAMGDGLKKAGKRVVCKWGGGVKEIRIDLAEVRLKR